MKYAGADWLTNSANLDLSSLGVRVADILGQVYQGIYHVDRDVLRHPKIWSNNDAIKISIRDELASFDSPRLMILFLCCQKSDIHFVISGSAKGHLSLLFRDDIDLSQKPSFIGKPLNFSRMYKFYLANEKQDILWRYGEDESISIRPQRKTFSYEAVWELLRISHDLAIRASISGRCANGRGLELQLSKRKREGRTMERHPTWDEAIKLWGPYADALQPDQETAGDLVASR